MFVSRSTSIKYTPYLLLARLYLILWLLESDRDGLNSMAVNVFVCTAFVC